MSDREAKRIRLQLRDSALDLSEPYGRLQGNVDYRGQLTRNSSFKGRRRLEHWSPGHPTGVNRGERKPKIYMLIVKFRRRQGLAHRLGCDRLNVVRYQHGPWETTIA